MQPVETDVMREARGPSSEAVLSLLPQQKPFRFIDSISRMDQNGIEGTYTFSESEFFYAGHFPGNPITPGVILLECMCQIGIVAHGIYLFALECDARTWMQDALRWTTFFSDAECEFFAPVYPGDFVTVRATKLFWRRHKLKSKIELYRNGQLIAQAVASGVGVKNG